MKGKSKNQQQFSLNTMLLAQRVVLGWGLTRKEKFFKDLGLGRVWGRRKKIARLTGRSMPYLVSDMFDYISTNRRSALSDVTREIVRVEWYLLGFERQFDRSLRTTSLRDLFAQRHDTFMKSLAADGYDLHEGEIVPLSLENLRETKDDLETLLNRAGFKIPLTHYHQAWDNYVLGNWEAANAQLRSFLEAVFDDIALALYPQEAQKRASGGHRRQVLQSKGFIENEKGSLIRGFFELAHTRGSHPGLSDEEDCRLRHGVAMQLASYYVNKYLEA